MVPRGHLELDKIQKAPGSIIARINKNAANITEQDIDDWIVPGLMREYSPRFSSLARHSYNISRPRECGIALAAFKEHAREAIRNALVVFLFRSQHWRSGRDIESYIHTTLRRLANGIRIDSDSIKKISVPICPACRHYGSKEYLSYDGKMLRCSACVKLSENSLDESERRLRSIFALHSRKGFRCPDCNRFIPLSHTHSNQAVSCPFDDCSWFGIVDELEPMCHPSGLSNRHTVSINTPINKSQWQDLFASYDIDVCDQLELSQQYKREYDVLSTVIDLQSSHTNSFKKRLMYKAYKNMLQIAPDEMVSYLVHRKTPGELPIQSRIFQEFIRLIENELPISYIKGGKTIEVESLLDPNLDLFLGLSEFTSIVRENGIVPNCTKETYIGGRLSRNFGPCFIGLLLDVQDNNGKSLMDSVQFYTFAQIKMKDYVAPGIMVKVIHYRIPSHYEMNGLVNLQRVRRKIVDSVYQRLHGQKRVVGKDSIHEICT